MASSGWNTPSAYSLSLVGGSSFQSSLRSIGTSTSLNNGLPSRDTCVQGPMFAGLLRLSQLWLKCTRWRLAVVHTPITESGAVGSVGLLPSSVSSVFGICIAIVWTLRSLVAFTANALPGIGMRCALWIGRNAARSKIEPRST